MQGAFLHKNSRATIDGKANYGGCVIEASTDFLRELSQQGCANGYIRLIYSESPRHPRQKYLLTVKGLALYHEEGYKRLLVKEDSY